MRPVRRVALTLAVATSVAVATGGPAFAHEEAPPPSAARLPMSVVLTAASLLVLAAAGAVAIARRRNRLRPSQVAAVALVFTGVAHCALVPEHWEEGWPLGLFFVLSGVLLLGQAAAVWRRPTAQVYASVIASTVGLVALYFMARTVALPLVAHRDPFLFEDLPVKAAELLAGALSVMALLPRADKTPIPARAAAA